MCAVTRQALEASRMQGRKAYLARAGNVLTWTFDPFGSHTLTVIGEVTETGVRTTRLFSRAK